MVIKNRSPIAMILKQLKPRKALNKAYLKLKPNRSKIDSFKTHLTQLLDRIDHTSKIFLSQTSA